jgi:hypothetical protein
MIVAYALSAHDGEAFFFEDRESRIFCPICGTLLAKDFLPRRVKPRKKWDISSTYENRTIVTEKFKVWCETQSFQAVRFRPVNEEPRYYSFEPLRVLQFDPRRARFDNRCAVCGNYESVIIAGPLTLLEIPAPVEHGFFRTDLEFGSRWEKTPLIVVGMQTKNLMEQEAFQHIYFKPIEG